MHLAQDAEAASLQEAAAAAEAAAEAAAAEARTAVAEQKRLSRALNEAEGELQRAKGPTGPKVPHNLEADSAFPSLLRPLVMRNTV